MLIDQLKLKDANDGVGPQMRQRSNNSPGSMAEKLTAKEMYRVLTTDLQRRPEIGLCKALVDRVLHPPNPFEPKAVRRPQQWSVLALLALATGLVTFIYFNFVR